MKLEIATHEEIPDDLQHTKERKPDFLKIIVDMKGNKLVLHIEYQVRSEPNMVYRMAEYCIMLKRRYRLNVKQYVIFMGPGRSDMETSIESENLSFRYNLLALSAIDYRIFLQSEIPEEKILAVLSDFGETPSGTAVKDIINEIHQSVQTELDKSRYLNQIRVLGQLRNLNKQITEAMDSISAIWKKEKDLLFYWGRKEGKQIGQKIGKQEGEKIGEKIGEKKKAITIALKMKEMNFETETIAKLTGLDMDEIARLVKDRPEKS